MRKQLIILLALSSLVLGSCASYNPGKYADVMKGEPPKKTPINAEVNSSLSPSPFVYVNFTFGNTSENEWRRIKKIRFTNVSGLSDARLLVGQDLYFWAEGVKRKVSIDNHNSQMFWGGMSALLAAGAVASSNSGNYNATIGLAGASLIGAAVVDINNIVDRVSSLEMASLVPPTHIYRPFSVPPGLYIPRWAVFEVPEGKTIEFLEFEVEYLSGKKAEYKVVINGTPVSRGRKK